MMSWIPIIAWASLWLSVVLTILGFLMGEWWLFAVAAVLSTAFASVALALALLSPVVPLLQISWALTSHQQNLRYRLVASLTAVGLWGVWVLLNVSHLLQHL